MSRRSTRLALSVAAILAILGAFQIAAPPDGFFSGDQGAKYLQTVAFARQGPFHPDIQSASRDLDPDLDHQILENRGGRLVGVFSWLLPMISAPFFAAFGMRGLYVVPALSAVALFLAAAAIGRRLSGGDGLRTAWMVVLTAPVLFYGAEMWEHAPAAACALAAALALAPVNAQRPTPNSQSTPNAQLPKLTTFLLAGVLIGVAVLFREEAAFALPALVVARAIVMPRDRRLADVIRCGALATAGMLAVLVAAIPVNVIVYGSALPLHLSVEVGKTNAHPPARAALFAQILLPARLAVVFMGCAVIGALAAWLHRRNRSGPWFAITIGCVLALVTIAIAIPAWRMAVFGEPYYDAYDSASIAHTWSFCFAILLVPLLDPDDDRGGLVGYLCAVAVVMAFGALFIIPSAGGAQWSPRYLFAAAPLLAAAASLPAWPRADAADRRARLVAWTARLVLAGAVLAHMDGLWILADAKRRNARIVHQLAELTSPGDVVISDIAWFPQVTAELIPSRRVLFARSPAEVSYLAATAAARGMRSVALVISPPETGYYAPGTLDAAREGCTYVRNARHSFGERGLILHRYACQPPVAVVK